MDLSQMFFLITWSVVISADVISAPLTARARTLKNHPGQACHVTHIRSDWLVRKLLLYSSVVDESSTQPSRYESP